MTFDFRASIPASVVAGGCFVVVLVKIVTASAPPAKSPPTSDQRMTIAMIFRDQEPRWNARAAQDFPADHWSVRDDFHAQELRLVEDLVGRRGYAVEDVLRVLDEDLHAVPNERNVLAVPCKPRPFYD